MLTVSDLCRPKRLCSSLLRYDNTCRPSPIRRVRELLTDGDAEAVRRCAEPKKEVKKQDKEDLCDALNGLIRRRDFYVEADFRETPLPDRARELLGRDRDERTPIEILELNYRLMKACLPKDIK